MADKIFLSTEPKPGDTFNVLLAKLLTKFGGKPKFGDYDITLLRRILEQLSGVSVPPDFQTGETLVAEILNQLSLTPGGGGVNLSGAAAPSGSVTPDFVGQIYLQSNGEVWQSTGTTVTSWESLGILGGLVFGPSASTVDSIAGAAEVLTAAFAGIFPTSVFTDFDFSQPTIVTNAADLSSSSYTSLRFRKLTSVGLDFSVTGNSAMTSLILDRLETVDGFDVSGCTNLTTVSIPNLESVGGDFSFSNDTSLVSLSAPSLTSVGNDLLLDGSSSLTTFSAPLLVTIANDVSVGGAALITFSLPLLQTYGGNLSASNTLEVLNLPALNAEGNILLNASVLAGLTTLNLNSVPAVAGSFDLSALSALTSVNVSALATVGADLNIQGTVLASFSAPALTTIPGAFLAAGIGTLTTLSLPLLATVNSTFEIQGTAVTTLSLPSLATPYPATISSDATLQVLNLPALTDQGALLTDLANLSGLTTLNINSLTAIAADLSFPINTNLASLNISSLVSIGGNLLIDTTQLVSFSGPSLTTIIGNIQAAGLATLTTFSLPVWLPTDGTTIDFPGCSLDQASVDQILARCVASGVTTCSISLSGGANATPSAQGLADVLTLQGAGNTVITN